MDDELLIECSRQYPTTALVIQSTWTTIKNHLCEENIGGYERRMYVEFHNFIYFVSNTQIINFERVT